MLGNRIKSIESLKSSNHAYCICVGLSENREAFRLHIERPLRKFDRLIVVNLVETAPGRQESKITEAFVRQLLLFNNPKVTYVGFDFHEYW